MMILESKWNGWLESSDTIRVAWLLIHAFSEWLSLWYRCTVKPCLRGMEWARNCEMRDRQQETHWLDHDLQRNFPCMDYGLCDQSSSSTENQREEKQPFLIWLRSLVYRKTGISRLSYSSVVKQFQLFGECFKHHTPIKVLHNICLPMQTVII